MAKKFVLKYPVTVGDLKVTEVTINRPKTKDFIAVGSNPADSAAADAALLSSLSGLPMSVVSQIDIDDLSIIRVQLALIWYCYFSSEEYKENPTGAEETEAPQSGTAKAS